MERSPRSTTTVRKARPRSGGMGGLACAIWLLLVSSRAALLAQSMTLEEFSIKEKSVVRLAEDALRLAQDKDECGLSLCVDNCARHACSATHNDNFICSNTLRSVADCDQLNPNKTCLQLQLNFGKNGFVKVPPTFSNFSNDNLRPEIKRAICSQSNLQFIASSRINRTFWNYFGSVEGVFRMFPGRVSEPGKGCITYDPRKRPWYILATAVIKDLVVLLDTGQESLETYNSAVNIVDELLGTMRSNDTVNVVTYDSTSASLIQPNSILVDANNNASLPSIFNLSNITNKVSSGISNLTVGFDAALATLNPTSKLKIILVFTDGTKFSNMPGSIDDLGLNRTIADLNANKVVVFFFSVGPGEEDSPPDPLTNLRTLSCRMNCSVTYVSRTDAIWNPLWAIRPYFDYQAKLRFKPNVTFWTEPYYDFDGLGEVATVSYPVYEDGILYGVAGVDVFANFSDNVIIQQKLVNPNVGPMPLPCQTRHVNLSQCTKAVDPGLKPLCEQDVFLNESPEEVYKKLLCCDTCAVQHRKKRDLVPIYSAAAGTSVFVIILMLIIVVLASKYRAARKYVEEIQQDFAKASISTNLFSYKELKRATRGFHKDNKLGEGGFGEVFLGKIKDGSQVAVKKLALDSKQGKPQFLAEVMIISKVQHRNLVKLRGCCVEGRHRLLVYEYLEGKSLRETLLGTPDQIISIDWPTRFNIIVGTARGLAYLHDEINPRIIHRDIKASNILLDGNLEAKISDFGLAKLCPDEQTHLTTAIAGTLGYMAPEITRGQLTEKVDVFSYGVLLMEIVTGRVTMSITQSGTSICLIDEVRDVYKKAHESGLEEPFLSLVDANLHRAFNPAEVIRVLKVALLCANDNPASRPTISQVLALLSGAQPIPEYVLKYLLSPKRPAQASPPLYDIELWDSTHEDYLCMITNESASLESGPVLGNASAAHSGSAGGDSSLSPVNLSLSEGR